MIEDAGLQVLIIGLVTNWDGIRLRFEPITPALDEALAAIAIRLAQADSEEDAADAIEDLLNLTRDTAAGSYTRQLVARFNADEEPGTREITSFDVLEVKERDLDRSPAPGKDGQSALATVMTRDCDFQNVPLFFATNRARGLDASGTFAASPGKEISYGRMLVTIPTIHRIGNVEKPHWWTLFPEWREDERFITLGQITPLGQPEFGSQLEATLEGAAAKDLLVFLHGYNVSFDEAAQRAGQLAFDMKFPGAVILFSWPSAGKFRGYQADEERAAKSAGVFAEFLRGLENGPWNRVHVVAHSMGNRVMLEGMIKGARPKLPFGQLVFAAADLYTDQFEESFAQLQAAGELMSTSYASNRDWALRLSNWLHQSDRVGFIRGDEPFTAPMLETIDASAVETGFLSLNHSSFAEERSMITDIRTLVANGLSAERRGLTKTRKYWMFPR